MDAAGRERNGAANVAIRRSPDPDDGASASTSGAHLGRSSGRACHARVLATAEPVGRGVGRGVPRPPPAAAARRDPGRGRGSGAGRAGAFRAWHPPLPLAAPRGGDGAARYLARRAPARRARGRAGGWRGRSRVGCPVAGASGTHGHARRGRAPRAPRSAAGAVRPLWPAPRGSSGAGDRACLRLGLARRVRRGNGIPKGGRDGAARSARPGKAGSSRRATPGCRASTSPIRMASSARRKAAR